MVRLLRKSISKFEALVTIFVFYQLMLQELVIVMNNCKEEDKKFVSQAVAYVIKHSHKGIVPLCASLATLLQEHDRLQKQVKALQESAKRLKKNKFAQPTSPYQSSHLQSDVSDNYCPSETSCGTGANCHTVAYPLHQAEVRNQDFKKNTTLEKGNDFLQDIKGPPISCCSCQQCSDSRKMGQQCIFPPLKLGDVVVIKGELCGVVRYIGHIDLSLHPHIIFVGIQLDESIGHSNGVVCGKQYFACPSNYGLFVTLDDVLCIVK